MLENLDSYSYSRNGFKPWRMKNPIIWGNKGEASFPLCYLHKPRGLSDEDWNNFLDGFSFNLRRISPKKTGTGNS